MEKSNDRVKCLEQLNCRFVEQEVLVKNLKQEVEKKGRKVETLETVRVFSFFNLASIVQSKYGFIKCEDYRLLQLVSFQRIKHN